jgi:hypothetical protein
VRHCNGDFRGAENLKGKPWPFEDEKKLREWVESGVAIEAIVFSFDGKYSKNAVQQKMLDLGLKLREEEEIGGKMRISSSSPELPAELESVETTLKNLVVAMAELKQKGVDKTEVLRLRGFVSACKIYKELLVDYMDYRGLEEELLESRRKYAELKEKYEELAKKSSDNASM